MGEASWRELSTVQRPILRRSAVRNYVRSVQAACSSEWSRFVRPCEVAQKNTQRVTMEFQLLRSYTKQMQVCPASRVPRLSDRIPENCLAWRSPPAGVRCVPQESIDELVSLKNKWGDSLSVEEQATVLEQATDIAESFSGFASQARLEMHQQTTGPTKTRPVRVRASRPVAPGVWPGTHYSVTREMRRWHSFFVSAVLLA